MAVQIKSVFSKDKLSKAKKSTVHYIKVTKANKKGAAAALGGTLILHDGHTAGDFHIELKTTINDKRVTAYIEAGQVVFRTNKNKNWQVKSLEDAKKRFPDAKFV